jgi:hypothetical protein
VVNSKHELDGLSSELIGKTHSRCDRADPCGACVKSRLPSCVYQSTYTYDYGGAARVSFLVRVQWLESLYDACY